MRLPWGRRTSHEAILAELGSGDDGRGRPVGVPSVPKERGGLWEPDTAALEALESAVLAVEGQPATTECIA